MRTKTINVTIDRKFDLGNWNSVRIAVSQEVEVEDGENENEVINTTRAAVRAHIQHEIYVTRQALEQVENEQVAADADLPF